MMRSEHSSLEKIRQGAKIADIMLFLIVKGISILCFIGLFFLVIVMVSVRFVPLFSMHWFDEIQVWVFAGLIFYGAAGLWIMRDHFKLDALHKVIKSRSPAFGAGINLIIESASLFFIAVFTYESFVLQDTDMGFTNQFRIPDTYVHLTSLFIPGVFMVFYSCKNVTVSIITLVKVVRRKSEDTHEAAKDIMDHYSLRYLSESVRTFVHMFRNDSATPQDTSSGTD